MNELHLIELLMVVEFHLLVDVIPTCSVETFLLHSGSNSALMSLNSLFLIDINPPFGYDRARSSLNEAP